MYERSTASFEGILSCVCENERKCVYRIHFGGLKNGRDDTLRNEVIESRETRMGTEIDGLILHQIKR